MPKPIIHGTLNPIRKSVQIRFDPSQGTTTTQEFEGAGNNMSGLAAQFALRGSNYDLALNGVKSRLVAVDTKNIYQPESSEEVLERWELLANQDQLDIKESPAWEEMGIGLQTSVLRMVKYHEEGKHATTTAFTYGDLSPADQFYYLMTRGATHYTIPRWVIRVTANVSNTYQNLTEANGGVGTIYSTAEIQAPPGRLRSTIQSISPPAGNDYLTYGWLKVSNTEVTSSWNRVDVSAEFWLGQWATILYT